MSTGTWAWLVVAFPLAGTVALGLGYRVWPGRTAGWIGTAAILGSFACAIATFASLMGTDPEHRRGVAPPHHHPHPVRGDPKLTNLLDPPRGPMILPVSG